jgi:hypothetical protein
MELDSKTSLEVSLVAYIVTKDQTKAKKLDYRYFKNPTVRDIAYIISRNYIHNDEKAISRHEIIDAIARSKKYQYLLNKSDASYLLMACMGALDKDYACCGEGDFNLELKHLRKLKP